MIKPPTLAIPITSTALNMPSHFADEPNWLVLFTRIKFEKRIAEELALKNIECYVPMRTTFRKWSDRIKRVDVPLFNSYVFTRIRSRDKHNVLQVPGVIKLLSNGTQPAPVSQQEIDRIRLIESSRLLVEPENFYVAGEKVCVVNGPFTGMEGLLLMRLGGARLVIKIALLKQALSIQISEQDVRKVPAFSSF